MILLGANVLCGSEREGHITVTTIYADSDYILDQVRWQNAGLRTGNQRDRLVSPRLGAGVARQGVLILRDLHTVSAEPSSREQESIERGWRSLPPTAWHATWGH